MMYTSILDSRVLPGFIIASGLAVLIIIFYPNALRFYDIWTADNSIYSHGLLLLPISLYLIVREWKSTQNRISIQFRPISTVLLIGLSIIWFISEITHIQTASQVVFLFILCFYVASLLGMRSNFRLIFPILILLSAAPIWSIFSEPLQEPTAFAVNQLLKLTGYSSFQEGYLISIPEGIFEVGDTCSGLRFQIAAITATTLYVYTVRYSLFKSVVYVITASLIAFISNTIRIYIVVLAGHYTNMTHNLLVDHIWLGWLVFACSFMCFIVLTGLLENKHENDDTLVVDNIKTINSNEVNITKSIFLAFSIAAIASIGPIANYLLNTSIIENNFKTTDAQLNFDEWISIKPNNNWKPIWLPSDFELLTSYTNDDNKVDLFISTFFSQEQGREVINDMNRSFNDRKWRRIGGNHETVTIGDEKFIPIEEEVIIDTQGSKRVNWIWYYIGGMSTNNALSAKLYGITSVLKGRPDATVLIISTQSNADIADMRSTLNLFLSDNIYRIEEEMDRMRTSIR